MAVKFTECALPDFALPVFSPGLVHVSVRPSTDLHPLIFKQIFNLLSSPGETFLKIDVHSSRAQNSNPQFKTFS